MRLNDFSPKKRFGNELYCSPCFYTPLNLRNQGITARITTKIFTLPSRSAERAGCCSSERLPKQRPSFLRRRSGAFLSSAT